MYVLDLRIELRKLFSNYVAVGWVCGMSERTATAEDPEHSCKYFSHHETVRWV